MGFSLNRPARLNLPSLMSPRRFSKRDVQAEVDLSHFAAICGTTRSEWLGKVLGLLAKGGVARLLKEPAQEDFLGWVAKRAGEGAKEAILFLMFSINRQRDVGLFCLLDLENLEEFPNIPVKRAIPGFQGSIPPEMEGLEGFEASFCDFETRISEAVKAEEKRCQKCLKQA